MMQLTFLGSGCWQGIPAPFDDDAISKKVTWDSKDFRFRTALNLKTNTGKNILVEATPDIRLQCWKFNLTAPEAILISHWHFDHMFGLMELDWFAEKNRLTVYGNQVTKEWYTSRMNHINIDFQTIESFLPFTLDNIKITPIEVHHVETTHGFLFEDMDINKKISYLSDLHGIPQKTSELINNADAIITDATYLESDIDDDPTHLQDKQVIPFLKTLNAKEIILTNIGSYQGLTHADLKQKFPQFTIAYDGMARKY